MDHRMLRASMISSTSRVSPSLRGSNIQGWKVTCTSVHAANTVNLLSFSIHVFSRFDPMLKSESSRYFVFVGFGEG